MADRDKLGDHAAHRRAGDVRAFDPEGAEKPDGVGRHVVERIGRGDRPAGAGLRDQGSEVRGAERVEMRGAADVAVVEPDDAEAFAASPRQSESGQYTIGEVSPMMSRIAGSDIRPKLSYSMSIPLAWT